jgi:hypothetical protein
MRYKTQTTSPRRQHLICGHGGVQQRQQAGGNDGTCGLRLGVPVPHQDRQAEEGRPEHLLMAPVRGQSFRDCCWRPGLELATSDRVMLLLVPLDPFTFNYDNRQPIY